MRNIIYKQHIQANKFESAYIQGFMELASGFDQFGIPIDKLNLQEQWKISGVPTLSLDLIAE
jgi:hypothetical protein